MMKLIGILGLAAMSQVSAQVPTTGTVDRPGTFKFTWTLTGKIVKFDFACVQAAEYMVLNYGGNNKHSGYGVRCDANACDDSVVTGMDTGRLSAKQSLTNINVNGVNGGIEASVQRPLDTGDPDDVVIEPGKIQLYFACGNGPKENGQYHNQAGSLTAQEIAGPAPPTPPPPPTEPPPPTPAPEVPVNTGPVTSPGDCGYGGAVCTKTSCADFNCGGALAMFPRPKPMPCPASGCLLTHCCVEFLSCKDFSCPASTFQLNVRCPEGKCSQATCCQFDNNSVAVTDDLCPPLECLSCANPTNTACNFCLLKGGSMGCTGDLNKCLTDENSAVAQMVNSVAECGYGMTDDEGNVITIDVPADNGQQFQSAGGMMVSVSAVALLAPLMALLW